MSNQPNPTSVTTGQVRGSYLHLFTPYANKPTDTPKFSMTILLPKSDIATKQRIDAAINAAIQVGVASKWNGTRPLQVPNPIWDGDGLRQNGEHFGPECKGHWVFTASSKQQPAIVDATVQPILSQSEIYSGMYARVNVNFYPYFNSGKKGIGCGLGPVQKLMDGEPLGGGISAEAAFGGGIAPAQQQPYAPQSWETQQPMQPTYPQQPGQATYPQQPGAPTYPQQQPMYPQNTPSYQQPAYSQPQQQYAPSVQPPQQYVPPVQQPVQYDPITGLPITPGGIMGL